MSAAEDGDEGVVKILLWLDDVHPDQANWDGKTWLCKAAWGGEEEVVKILLGRDAINPDTRDEFEQTLLSHAAKNSRREW